MVLFSRCLPIEHWIDLFLLKHPAWWYVCRLLFKLAIWLWLVCFWLGNGCQKAVFGTTHHTAPERLTSPLKLQKKPSKRGGADSLPHFSKGLTSSHKIMAFYRWLWIIFSKDILDYPDLLLCYILGSIIKMNLKQEKLLWHFFSGALGGKYISLAESWFPWAS